MRVTDVYAADAAPVIIQESAEVTDVAYDNSTSYIISTCADGGVCTYDIN